MFLMIYHSEVYKEISLPVSDTIECVLTLDAREFNIHEKICLRAEAIDDGWRIFPKEGCLLLQQGMNPPYIDLKNGTLAHLITPQREQLHLLAVAGGQIPVMTKLNLSGLQELSFGHGPDNDIRYGFRELVSKRHGWIRKTENGTFLVDNSTNGIYRNGGKVKESCILQFGDRIDVFGLVIIYLGDLLCLGTRTDSVVEFGGEHVHELNRVAWQVAKPKAAAEEEGFFSRSPRNRPDLQMGTVNIETVPDPHFEKKKSLLLTVGPSLTMALPMLLGYGVMMAASRMSGGNSSAFMLLGLVTAVGSAVLGVIWGCANIRQSKKEEYETERHRVEAYSNYLVGVAQDLKQKYDYNVKALRETYPPPAEYCGYNSRTPRLWERNVTHPDFLFYRLGVGDVPFQVEITTPKMAFELDPDELKQRPEQIKNEYQTIQQVPVGIDFQEKRLVGLVSPQDGDRFSLMYTLVAGIASANCYTDVKMVFLADGDDAQNVRRWGFLKWLPHVWNETHTTRYLAMNAQERSDVFCELIETFRRRSQEDEGGTREKKEYVPKPFYILFVENPALLEGELLEKYVYGQQEAVGLATILMARNAQELPNECEDIIEADMEFCGIINTVEGKRQLVAFDGTSAQELEKLTRNICSLRVRESESNTTIPAQLEFLEMYGVHRVEELDAADQWRKSRTFNSMQVAIGHRSGGAVCYLDAHERFHGPHGLIAGTTGSGKSETLQTYILSLALKFSPDDVGFFLIDFKGGGMANLFDGLPHLLGKISNLSGNQVHRAMISIKSENRRRQRIFNEYGVNSIGNYTRLYKNGESSLPVPHLFIVIDEFAELKREQPDFMRELISVAQVGRSLGVHLILATQKPSGTVDDNIWSNAKFRLCLRVQDRQDSNDMLHKPDAAFITQAGRGFLQVGNDEVYEEFQSAWSGAIYNPGVNEGSRAAATLVTRTGKAGLVGSLSAARRYEKERKEWLRSLAEKLMELCPGLPDSPTQAEMDDLAKKLFAEEMMEKAGLGDDLPTRTALGNVLKLWPIGCRDTEKVADVLLASGEIMPYPREKTQLEAVVEYLNETARQEHYQPSMMLWLPVLPQRIFLDELPAWGDTEKKFTAADQWSLCAEMGLLDDPENQSQFSWRLDLGKNGHCALLGTVSSGKSVFLQTFAFSMMRQYDPSQINFYFIDFSSRMLAPFEEDAHVGAILYDNDLEQIGKLIHLLEGMMQERKEMFGGGTYSQYIQTHEEQYPAVVVVIDNYSAFAEKTGGDHESTILRMAREGVGYGMYLVISAGGFGINDLPSRIADNFRNVVCLDMGDKFKFMEALHVSHLNVLPEQGVPGRGLVSTGEGIYEFQTALALNAENDYARGRALTEWCEKETAAWQGEPARRVPTIPKEPVFSQLQKHDGWNAAVRDDSKLPFAYFQEDASLYSVDLSSVYCYTILGRVRTGKTNTLKALLQSAAEKKGSLAVFEKGETRMESLAKKLGAEYLNSDQALFDFWKRMTPVFAERNKKKQTLIAKSYTEREIYEEMRKEPPIFIFISDLGKYMESVYLPESGIGDMKGFMENILSRGSAHNIFFFATMTPEDYGNLAGRPAFQSFVSGKKGVLLGGNPNGQRMFTFQNISYLDMSKTLKTGIGITPDSQDDTQARYLVIPLAER